LDQPGDSSARGQSANHLRSLSARSVTDNFDHFDQLREGIAKAGQACSSSVVQAEKEQTCAQRDP
jgi:hypothetical protein